jgi:methyl-accepting chemotaxis protein
MLRIATPWHSKLASRIEELESLLESTGEQAVLNGHKLTSLDRSMAIIEFDPEGNILDANENFLKTFGYSRASIIGKHHSMFVLKSHRTSPEYSSFWSRLKKGEFYSGEFVRLDSRGNQVCLYATYNPIFDEQGRVQRVIKVAIDTTQKKKEINELSSRNDLVERTFAVIQFSLDGTITNANENFLSVMGYSLDEIQGKHHSMFVEARYKHSKEYAEFWNQLRGGKLQSGEFLRIGQGGKEVYIQASYNPVLKFASDITDAVHSRQRTAQVATSVAASVSEMTQTIREISANVTSTATLAKNAESLSDDARMGVENLDEQSRTIGKVVETIRDLAEQTNLLALNATIESARAGDAGRGFAVVASEVKELAKQTAKATQSIEQTVQMIQVSIAGVVTSTENITNSVASVSQNMVVISAAVEEQSVTMKSLADTANELQQGNSNH